MKLNWFYLAMFLFSGWKLMSENTKSVGVKNNTKIKIDDIVKITCQGVHKNDIGRVMGIHGLGQFYEVKVPTAFDHPSGYSIYHVRKNDMAPANFFEKLTIKV